MVLLLSAACGGGGGGAVVPVTNNARLSAADLDVPSGASVVDLVVSLAAVPSPAPALLQVGITLPSALQVAPSNRLTQAQTMSDLDGDFVGEQFVVVCGDAHAAAAAPLQQGPLFHLRLTTTSPRQPGTYAIELRSLRAATAAGDQVTADSSAVTVQAVVH